ncbi:hypothetical protein RV10_GL004518 [Enterococcus pallens]|nr:hypothetical protein RV10_GL004518 [Enterococcus pallens]
MKKQNLLLCKSTRYFASEKNKNPGKSTFLNLLLAKWRGEKIFFLIGREKQKETLVFGRNA